MRKNFLALIAAAALLTGMSACSSESDNPAEPTPSQADILAQLKQGVWTEYDTILVAAGKKTAEELAEMPVVGMMIESDKTYFFTYTAEGAGNLVEGKVTYDKTTGTGTIAFPAIKDNPLSGQTVIFTATTDETLEFELNYEGVKTIATCAWLCENLDNWDTDDEGDWEELLTSYYQNFPTDAGPDPSIDWSRAEVVDVDGEKVTVTDLDKSLVWDEDAVGPARGATRAIAIGTVIKAGFSIFSSLFEEDPQEEANAKLDAIMEKLDNVLANQQLMKAKLDEINNRLIGIAQKLKQTEIVNLFNTRNKDFYNKLSVQNEKFFDDAYKAYKANKNDPDLADYAKAWVGKSEEFANLTWEYMKYLTTVQHTDYGTGMEAIYDGLTFDKYPWEHMGIGDRKSYRAYDLDMIAKSLFMISLYSTYGGLNNIEKKALYKMYATYKPQLKEFSEFLLSDPEEFLVCQIPGAHFVMHKQLQKYNYIGKDNDAPALEVYGHDAIYMPKWHEAGTIKIENPQELKKKMIRLGEMSAIFKYFSPNDSRMSWTKMLVDGNNAGGAVYALNTNGEPFLMLYNNNDPARNGVITVKREDDDALAMFGQMSEFAPTPDWQAVGFISSSNHRWTRVDPDRQYYIAIVEKHF